MIEKQIGKFFLTVLIAIGLALLVAYPFMWLWNWQMPEIFGLSEIGFWDAFGLKTLSILIFKTINYGGDKDK